MTANLRYWQAVLRDAEAELDAASTNSDLRIAAGKLMRARRQVSRLTQSRPELRANGARPARRRKKRIAGKCREEPHEQV